MWNLNKNKTESETRCMNVGGKSGNLLACKILQWKIAVTNPGTTNDCKTFM